MMRNIELEGTGISRNLQHLRRGKNLHPADVAKGTGLTLRTITDIEKGYRKRIFEDTLLRLAKFFDTSPEKLLEKPRKRFLNGYVIPAIALVAILILVLGYLGKDNRPWIEVDDTKLITENWTRTFPCSIYNVKSAQWDGRDVIVVSIACSSKEEPSLQVLDEKNGATLWSVLEDYEKLDTVFPDSLFESGIFLAENFEFADLWGDGSPELVVLMRHNVWYPSYLVTLNSKGEILGTYYHPGHLNHLLVRDIDEDSKDELLVTATSNVRGYGGGSFLILDSEHLSGAAIDSVSHRGKLANCKLKDGSLRRILFPSMPTEFMNLVETSRLDGHHSNFTANRKSQAEISIALGTSGKAFMVKVDTELNLIGDIIVVDYFRHINRDWLDKGLISRDYLAPEFLEDWASRILHFEEGSLIPR